MSKSKSSIAGAKEFMGEVGLEMKKTSWPERRELLESTVVVIVSIFLLSVFVALSDRVTVSVLRGLWNWLIPRG